MANLAQNHVQAKRNDAPALESRMDRLSSARLLERYVVVAALIGLVIVFSVLRPHTFATLGNLQSVLTSQAVLLTVALGLTVVLAAGDLDLSVGGMIGITAVVMAQVSGTLGLPWPLGLLISLSLAVLIGLINGFLIVKINVNPLITTLAMGTVLNGVASAISQSQTLTFGGGSMVDLLSIPFLGVDLPFWMSVVVVVVFWFVMQHHPAGRALYFTGEGREAARLIGIRTKRVRVIGLVVSALGAWLAGVVLISQTGAAQAGVGDPYLLPAYAAAFLGAATLTPGRFNPFGTFIGALLLAVGTNGLQLLGLASWVTDVFSGGILILAVGAAAVFGSSNNKIK